MIYNINQYNMYMNHESGTCWQRISWQWQPFGTQHQKLPPITSQRAHIWEMVQKTKTKDVVWRSTLMNPWSLEYLPILMKVIRPIHVIFGYTFNRFQYTTNILRTQGERVCFCESPLQQIKNLRSTSENPQKGKIQYLHIVFHEGTISSC